MADLQSPKDRITLRNGYGIPCLGFGTWKMPDGEVGIDAVHQALHDGYRHIDTAAAYDNEGTVGKALASGGISREDLFITTKVWNTDRGYDATLKAFEESRAKLHLDYVDLYLIHWPAAQGAEAEWQRTNQETWRALETLYLDGPGAHRRERAHLLVRHHRRGPAAYRRAGSSRPKRSRSRHHRLLNLLGKPAKAGFPFCGACGVRCENTWPTGWQRIGKDGRVFQRPSGLCRIVYRVRLGACAPDIRVAWRKERLHGG